MSSHAYRAGATSHPDDSTTGICVVFRAEHGKPRLLINNLVYVRPMHAPRAAQPGFGLMFDPRATDVLLLLRCKQINATASYTGALGNLAGFFLFYYGLREHDYLFLFVGCTS